VTGDILDTDTCGVKSELIGWNKRRRIVILIRRFVPFILEVVAVDYKREWIQEVISI